MNDHYTVCDYCHFVTLLPTVRYNGPCALMQRQIAYIVFSEIHDANKTFEIKQTHTLDLFTETAVLVYLYS